jgi:hypothetical protein
MVGGDGRQGPMEADGLARGIVDLCHSTFPTHVRADIANQLWHPHHAWTWLSTQYSRELLSIN